MKAHIRQITVNGLEYGWICRGRGKERHITIWRRLDGKRIFSRDMREHRVTPKMIATLIQAP